MIFDIETFLDNVAKCKRCPKLAPWRKFPSESHGKRNASAMIVSIAPGGDSLIQNQFWSGNGGKRLRKVLKTFNVNLEEIFYLTDAVKCGPPGNRKPISKEVENCKDYLVREVSIVNPDYILAFGEIPLKWFLDNFKPKIPLRFSKTTEMHNDEGYRIIEFDKFKLIPLLHPSNANRFFKDYKKYKGHLGKIFSLILGFESTS